MLTGEGADEWLVGYPWYKAEKLIGYLDLIPGLGFSQVARTAYLRMNKVPHFNNEWRREVESAVETLAYETQRLGLNGRVAGSHLTSMHSMDNYYVSKLLPLIAEAGVSAIPNPLINIMLQGRHDTFPKRRGLTRVREMLAHGIRVGWGQDCVLDPWYSLGTADMPYFIHSKPAPERACQG